MRPEPWYASTMLTIFLLACLSDASPDDSAGKGAPDPVEVATDCPAGLRVELSGHAALIFASLQTDAEVPAGVQVAAWTQPLSASWVFQCREVDSTLYTYWID